MILIKPSFLTKLDHYLLVNFPIIWETRFHFILYYSLIFFGLYFSLLFTFPISLTSIPSHDFFNYFVYTLFGLSFLVFCFYLYLQSRRKKIGISKGTVLYGMFFMYYVFLLILIIIPISFESILTTRIRNIPSITEYTHALRDISENRIQPSDFFYIIKKLGIEMRDSKLASLQREVEAADNDRYPVLARLATLERETSSMYDNIKLYENDTSMDAVVLAILNTYLVYLAFSTILLRFIKWKQFWISLFSILLLLVPAALGQFYDSNLLVIVFGLIALLWFSKEKQYWILLLVLLYALFYVSGHYEGEEFTGASLFLFVLVHSLYYLFLMRRYTSYNKKTTIEIVNYIILNFSLIMTLGLLSMSLSTLGTWRASEIVQIIILCLLHFGIVILLPVIAKPLINLTLIPEIK